MDVSELLAELDRLGVELATDGERLRYRPRFAVTPCLRAAIAERRDELLMLLGADEAGVRRRADAMRAQLPPTGPIPPLTTRPTTPISARSCSSCGEPLRRRERYRCDRCVRAAWSALREVRVRPTGAWDGDG